MPGVARNYDVDGIHLDYIRTGGKCYCDKCKAEFQKKFGKPIANATNEDWIVWQREAIGDMVKRTTEGVKAVRPCAKMAAAVLSDIPLGAKQGQNPAEWTRRVWMDMIIPMDYDKRTEKVRANEKEFLELLGKEKDRLFPRFCLYTHKYSAKGFSTAVSRSPELLKEQIELARWLGVHGYCLYVDSYLNDEIFQMLKSDINKEKAVLYFR